jgi:hypothetical protein
VNKKNRQGGRSALPGWCLKLAAGYFRNFTVVGLAGVVTAAPNGQNKLLAASSSVASAIIVDLLQLASAALTRLTMFVSG